MGPMDLSKEMLTVSQVAVVGLGVVGVVAIPELSVLFAGRGAFLSF